MGVKSIAEMAGLMAYLFVMGVEDPGVASRRAWRVAERGRGVARPGPSMGEG